MSDKSPEEAFIDDEVESAIAPYRAMGLSPEVLAEMARMLRLALTEHPVGQELVEALRPRSVDESGEQPTKGFNGIAKTRGAR